MVCIHKFASDLMLERINFKPMTLIVGTFNPGWDNLDNYAQWFYGRNHNNYFWDVLPRLYGYGSLRNASKKEWQYFCQQHHIALTDLLYSINDADPTNLTHVKQLKSYRDDVIARFQQFTEVDIIAILKNYPSISQVYLTRRVAGFWRQKWLPIENYCQANAKVAQTLLTPSGSARFQMRSGMQCSLADFIFKAWQDHWHFVPF